MQNFNENLGILLLIGVYTVMVKAEMPINYIVIAFGLFISISMSGIYGLYRRQRQA